MHRDWILQACKLMDPASTMKKGIALENITIKLIDEQLEQCHLSNQNIRDLSYRLLEYGEKIKPARDKRLAHYDRDHQINSVILGETSEHDLNEFIHNIQKYCDEVGRTIGLGPLSFSGSGCKGDVLDFLRYLRHGEHA
jgi:hypothetical protein